MDSLPKNVIRVKIESKDYDKRKEEIMLKLHEFLSNPKYHYGIIGSPGIGKSSATIEYLLQQNKKFLYVASTKPVAEQLATRFNLQVYHAGNKAKSDQLITIYDHLHEFVDFDNLEATQEIVLVVDECHNIIQHRDFRNVAINDLEIYSKYFNKVIYLTATPIDYRAYGEEFEYIYLDEDLEPITLYRVPFGIYSEVHDIAEIAAHEVKEKGLQVLVYLQSKGKALEELKDYLKQLNVKSVSVYNSEQNVWETDYYTAKENFIETGYVKAQVMITTYADGFSLLNEGFVFICCNSADVHVAYQAMNRLRKGCIRYYFMSNAYKNDRSFVELKDACDEEVLVWARLEQELIKKIPSVEARLATIKRNGNFTVDLEGKLDWAGIAKQSLILQQKELKENFYGLKTAFAQYNVDLVKLVRFPDRHELKFTEDSKIKILDYIYYSREHKEYIPLVYPYRDELNKIISLEKYLSPDEVKIFMYGEYVQRESSYDEKYQQLQLKDNPKDSQLKLRLMDKVTGSFTSEELDKLVSDECSMIDYKYKGSTQRLLRGLGFKVKRSSKHIGYTKEGKKLKENTYFIS